MRREDLYKAMSGIDADLLQKAATEGKEKASQHQQKGKKNRKNKIVKWPIMAVGAVAAAALIAIGGSYVVPMTLRSGSEGQEDIVAENMEPERNAGKNLFVLTASAAELTEQEKSSVESGGVYGLGMSEAMSSFGGYFSERFSIQGSNIRKVKLSIDKNGLYSVRRATDEEEKELNEKRKTEAGWNAECFEVTESHPFFYEEVEELGEFGSENYNYFFNRYENLGDAIELDYDPTMLYGFYLPEEKQADDTGDMQAAAWADTDQFDGAVLTVGVTFLDGSYEEHHYQVNSGSIYLEVDENDFIRWDKMERFLTAEEEERLANGEEIPNAYGLLVEQID